MSADNHPGLFDHIDTSSLCQDATHDHSLTPHHRPSTRFPLLYGDNQGDNMFDEDSDYEGPWDDYDYEPNTFATTPQVKMVDPELERLLADDDKVREGVSHRHVVTSAQRRCVYCGGNLDSYGNPLVPKLPDPQLEALLREEEEIELRTRLGAEYNAYKDNLETEFQERKNKLVSEMFEHGYESACKDYDYRISQFIAWVIMEGLDFDVIRNAVAISQGAS